MAEGYAVDVVGVASVTSNLSALLDELGLAVADAAAALEAAQSAVAGEPLVSSALDASTNTRRQTGPAAVARAGELVATVQQTTLDYAQADLEMADVTEARAKVVDVFPFRMRPV